MTRNAKLGVVVKVCPSGVRMVVTEEEQSGHDPLKQLGSGPLVKRRDGGSRTRNATGYEPVPGTARIAAMSFDAKRGCAPARVL